MKKALLTLIFISVYLMSCLPSYAQWVKIYNEDQANRIMLDIYFLPSNPNYGWICGLDSRVMRTTDRGETWKESKIDYTKNGWSGFFESIFFLNTKVGYVSGPGGIYKSTDGGISWNLSSKEYVWGCYFADENYGMAIGGGCNDPQSFYRTTNGGNTWTINEYNETNTGMTDLYLPSSTGDGLAVSSGYIWATTDGGINWQIRNTTGGVDWQEELSFKGNTFILPYSRGCSGGYASGGVRFSTDGGYTYIDTDLGASMFGAFVISDSVGWVCGKKNTVKKTTDAGNTWTQYNCGLLVEDDMDDIYFIDDTTGFVVGMGIYKYKLPGTYQSKINILDSSSCDGDPVLLEADGDYAFYEWNGVIGGKYLDVEESGTYILKVYNMPCDTVFADTVKIDVHTATGFSIDSSPADLCQGDTAYISIDANELMEYKWSDNYSGEERIFTGDTSVSVELLDQYGCTLEKEFNFNFAPLGKVDFKDYVRAVCKNEPVYLEAVLENVSDFVWYKDGKPISSNQNPIKVDSGSVYYIIAKNKRACTSASDTVSISYMYLQDQISIMPLEGLSNIDLGEMKVASPLSFTIAVQNNSNSDYLLGEAFMEQNACFSIPKSQLPTLIPADSILELEVNFFCSDYGDIKDKLVLRDLCSYDSIEVKINRLHNVFIVDTKCEVPLTVTNVKMKYPRLTQAAAKVSSGKIIADIIYISDKSENLNITIYDAIGNNIGNMIANQHLISSGDLNTYSVNCEFDNHNLKSGLYFIRANVSGAISNMKVAITK